MRLDKLTTAFQQALAEAQSLAVARDNPYIEPAHLLAALLSQGEGVVPALVAKVAGSAKGLGDAQGDLIVGIDQRNHFKLQNDIAIFNVGCD